MYNSSGINEEGIDKLVIDIYNSANAIHKNFDNICNLVEQTSECFKTEIGDEYRNNFDIYKIKFKDIEKNIMGYSEKLIKVKMKYQNINYEIEKNLKDSADNISDQYK